MSIKKLMITVALIALLLITVKYARFSFWMYGPANSAIYIYSGDSRFEFIIWLDMNRLDRVIAIGWYRSYIGPSILGQGIFIQSGPVPPA